MFLVADAETHAGAGLDHRLQLAGVECGDGCVPLEMSMNSYFLEARS